MNFISTLLLTKQEDGYTVTAPALPGLTTEGNTYDEALAHARDAIALYIAEAEAAGEPVPVEGAHPALAEVAVRPRYEGRSVSFAPRVVAS